MKKLIAASLLLFLVNEIFSQENSIWVDSVLNRVLLHQVAVYNKNYKRINIADIQFVTADTVVNCQWSRPKFIDNIFHDSFDGVLIENQVIFDTSTNTFDHHFIDFKTPKRDEDGNYLGDTIIFLVNRFGAAQNNTGKNSGLIKKLKHTEWLNSSIVLEGKVVELDSCHQLFRLQFDDDFEFHQFYGANQTQCSTQAMREELDVGVEGDAKTFFTYCNSLQGHYINIRKGIWQVERRQLHLIDLDEKRVLVFEIEKLNSKELHLKLKGFDYRVMMKATPFQSYK